MNTISYDHPTRPPATLLLEWEQARAALEATLAGPPHGEAVIIAEEHALAALTAGTELARAVLAERWPTVHDLLASGAQLEDIAGALDMTTAEVRAGVLAWAQSQRDLLRATGHHGMTASQYTDATTLVDAETDRWSVIDTIAGNAGGDL